MSLKQKTLFQILGSTILVFALMHSLYAADFAAVVVSPVTKTLVLSEGEERSFIFIARNESSKTQRVRIAPRYWSVTDENMSVPLESWLEITPSFFEIVAGEEKEVVCKVSVPEEAKGELSATIAFRPEPEEGQPINVVFSVSVYLMIKGTEDINCKIDDIKFSNPVGGDILAVRTVLRNDGNIHVKPSIRIIIQDMFGKRELAKTLLDYGKPAYPGKSQEYRGGLYNLKLKPGIYRALVNVEVENIAYEFKKRFYFIVGREGRVIFTFFRKER